MFRSLQGRIRIVKNFFNYYIFKITKPSKSQYIVTLKPERKKKFKFKAGQYAKFSFAGEVTVPLSIASTPSSTSIELHINQQAPLSKKKYFKKYMIAILNNLNLALERWVMEMLLLIKK